MFYLTYVLQHRAADERKNNEYPDSPGRTQDQKWKKIRFPKEADTNSSDTRRQGRISIAPGVSPGIRISPPNSDRTITVRLEEAIVQLLDEALTSRHFVPLRARLGASFVRATLGSRVGAPLARAPDCVDLDTLAADFAPSKRTASVA